jgi:hypothetical protein
MLVLKVVPRCNDLTVTLKFRTLNTGSCWIVDRWPFGAIGRHKTFHTGCFGKRIVKLIRELLNEQADRHDEFEN